MTAGAEDVPALADAPPGAGVAAGPGAPPRSDRSSLAANAMAYWFASGTTLVGSLVRGKVAAVVLGDRGLGVTGTLAVLTAFVVTLASLGLGIGGVKLISEARGRGDDEGAQRLVSFLVWVPVTVGTAAFLVTVPLSGWLSGLMLDKGGYGSYVVVTMLAVPFSLLASSFQLVLQGYERAGRLAVTSVATAVLVTLASVPLTTEFGLDGAIAATPLAAVVTAAVFVARDPWIARTALRLHRVAGAVRVQLWTLAAASVVASLMTYGADTIVRARASHVLGIPLNGLYQPVQMFSSVVMPQLVGALSLVLLPRLSYEFGAERREEVAAVLRGGARAAAVLAVTVSLMTMALAEVFVVVFFNTEFLPSAHVLAVQVAAEVPRFLAYVLGAAVVPAGLIRQWVGIGVVSTLARVGVAAGLMPSMHLYALALSVVVEWAVALALTTAVLWRAIGWRPGRDLVALVLAAAAVVALAVLVSLRAPWAPTLLLAATAVWLAAVGRREVALVAHALRLDRFRGASA
ncbi:O-antigen/teichoic acid export membrane protein [Motilibacter rhizosphaerae]|uniref:O-antigen/teichoic acid export membrane protein n=1 Tax=Motilibacter rhizosphaerae TaxID=598652 RepID=A0A4Q7NVJ9_9ACTN|nr:polysaccharide biosynthesis C-terminal domain-containing protein [Motilibacter rhizosphaerae]RZS91283.1 O-antigen/teichoic acid export membrane protein [Motilibacter rhizosphaerae]